MLESANNKYSAGLHLTILVRLIIHRKLSNNAIPLSGNPGSQYLKSWALKNQYKVKSNAQMVHHRTSRFHTATTHVMGQMITSGLIGVGIPIPKFPACVYHFKDNVRKLVMVLGSAELVRIAFIDSTIAGEPQAIRSGLLSHNLAAVSGVHPL